jgi:hypothetical protein
MSKQICPLMKKRCIEHDCKFWRHLLGKDPQTGAEIDRWDCSFAWLPTLLMNVGKQVNDLGGSIDSFRNEQSLNTLGSIAKIVDDRQLKRLKGDG